MYPQTALERAHRAYGDFGREVPPVVLLVQVHDGMIGKLTEARAAILAGRIEDRYDATMKVSSVVEALHLALDDERGGQIAQNLGRIYTYMLHQLRAINLSNDPALCDELIERLRELRLGWASHLELAPTAPLETAAVSA